MMIEPSDSERAGWPDVTREYVEALEADRDAALRSSVGYRNAYDGAAEACRAFKAQRDQARAALRAILASDGSEGEYSVLGLFNAREQAWEALEKGRLSSDPAADPS